MVLNLNVPALEDKPLINAETRPQKISEFLAALPLSNPIESAPLLLDEMEILNRQRISSESRFKALEVYRSAIINITDELRPEYSLAPLPLSRTAKGHAAAAESLWMELGYGYKLALLDQQTQLFNLNSSKAKALTVYRAIEALRQASMIYYQTYFNVPGSVWRDLHQLYFYAAQQSLHDIEVAPESKSSTINLLYKQALLMALADPQHLSQQEIAQVEEYVIRHAKHTRIQGLGMLDNPAGIFLISLNSDKPPIPFAKNDKLADNENDILFITMDLARLAHKHLQMLQSGNVSKTSGLHENAKDPRYQDMLTYLIKHWGASPKRIYNRSRRRNITSLGIGVKTAHYFINHQKPYVQPKIADDAGLGLADAGNPDPQQETGIDPSLWEVVNISAGGTALRKLPNSTANVRIGELLSMKSDGERSWSVAVLRWANNGGHDQLDIGTQLIAPTAKAAGARATNQPRFEPVLLLPAMPKLRQAASIVSECGMFSPARILEIDENGSISRVMVTKLVERTGSFERFQYSQLYEV
ncbi:Cyclic-di-GMP receptor FimW [Methylophilaceae bacterium]|nr:Cyclic-di-GMP receptor FimW [Methylophilaceae bacterium]